MSHFFRLAFDMLEAGTNGSGCFAVAHGTGTQAGDQQETKSLSMTIASTKKQALNEKLLIGSVKSNVRHPRDHIDLYLCWTDHL